MLTMRNLQLHEDLPDLVVGVKVIQRLQHTVMGTTQVVIARSSASRSRTPPCKAYLVLLKLHWVCAPFLHHLVRSYIGKVILIKHIL